MPNTIKEYLETLPDPLNKIAIRECRLHMKRIGASDGYMDLAENSLHDSIMAAFRWAHSEHGFKFWDDVCQQARNGIKITPDEGAASTTSDTAETRTRQNKPR